MPVRKPSHIETQDPKYLAFRRTILGWWLLWGVASVLAWLLWGQIALVLSLVGLGALLLYTILNLYHRLQVEQVQHYWQTEALFSLYSAVPITQPLPPMRLWAASPDFMTLAISIIRQHRPGIVLEVGSGVSTVIMGYCLREQGDGELIALEHEKHFAQVTADNILAHGLENVAQVLHAPLKPVSIKADVHLWYDISALNDLPPINLLVVDGPPEKTQRYARYPALPLLFSRLSEGAIILVDDFMRDDEYAAVNRWLDEFSLEVVGTFANEKGAVILRKVSR